MANKPVKIDEDKVVDICIQFQEWWKKEIGQTVNLRHVGKVNEFISQILGELRIEQ